MSLMTGARKRLRRLDTPSELWITKRAGIAAWRGTRKDWGERLRDCSRYELIFLFQHVLSIPRQFFPRLSQEPLDHVHRAPFPWFQAPHRLQTSSLKPLLRRMILQPANAHTTTVSESSQTSMPFIRSSFSGRPAT